MAALKPVSPALAGKPESDLLRLLFSYDEIRIERSTSCIDGLDIVFQKNGIPGTEVQIGLILDFTEMGCSRNVPLPTGVLARCYSGGQA